MIDKRFIDAVEKRLLKDQSWRTSSKIEAEALLALFKNGGREVRIWAAEALGESRVIQAKISETLIAAFRTERDITSMVMIIQSLGILRYKKSTSLLLQNLKNKNPDIRAHAAIALSQIPSLTSARAISKLLEVEKSPRVRAWLLKSLHDLRQGDRTPELARLARSKDSWVRFTAKHFLSEIKKIRGVKGR